MIREDYIMRMIEQFMQGLALILSSKLKERWKEMDENIGALCEKLLGTDYQMIRHVEPEDIEDLLRNGTFVDPARAFVLARLFYEQADALVKREQLLAAQTLFFKAAILFMEIIRSGNQQLSSQSQEKVEAIIPHIPRALQTVAFQHRLFEYYELTGAFAKAENILFELAEKDVAGIFEDGILFYSRVAKKTEHELEKGNFSNAEVDEGKADFIRKFMRTKS